MSMPDLIKPIAGGPPPPPRGTRSVASRYDWASHADGEFHLWHDDPDAGDRDARRAFQRIRLAAREWAHRRDGHIESRTTNGGRQVWIAIHLPDGGDQ